MCVFPAQIVGILCTKKKKKEEKEKMKRNEKKSERNLRK